MFLNSKPYLAGLFGLNCLNATLFLKGYNVSSIERRSSGMIDFPQLLNFSKIFQIAGNLSFFQHSVLVSKSLKDILGNKNLNLFFNIVAEKIGCPQFSEIFGSTVCQNDSIFLFVLKTISNLMSSERKSFQESRTVFVSSLYFVGLGFSLIIL